MSNLPPRREPWRRPVHRLRRSRQTLLRSPTATGPPPGPPPSAEATAGSAETLPALASAKASLFAGSRIL